MGKMNYLLIGTLGLSLLANLYLGSRTCHLNAQVQNAKQAERKFSVYLKKLDIESFSSEVKRTLQLTEIERDVTREKWNEEPIDPEGLRFGYIKSKSDEILSATIELDKSYKELEQILKK